MTRTFGASGDEGLVGARADVNPNIGADDGIRKTERAVNRC
jgi:hypothetical protein